MQNENWLRFQKIMHYFDFIQPQDDTMKFHPVSAREVKVTCPVKRGHTEIFDFAESKTQCDWIFQTGYPRKENEVWVWVLIR